MANRKRQDRLPGVEGNIPELEELGFEYAAIRDRRMATLEEEVELKGKILDAMKRHDRMDYKYEDLEIRRIPGEEKIKVKVSKKEAEFDVAYEIIMNIDQIIKSIQQEQCCNCKYGKAIMALDPLRDEPDSPVTKRIRSSRSVRSGTGRKQRAAVPDKSKACKKCGKTKPLNDFPKNKGCKDGHTPVCKACTYERAKKVKHGKSKESEPVGRLYNCSKCGEQFASIERLERHKAVVHGNM